MGLVTAEAILKALPNPTHVRRFVKPLFKFNLDAPFGFGKFSTHSERIPHYKAAVVRVNNGEIVFAD